MQCMEGEVKREKMSAQAFNSQLELQVSEGDIHDILSQIAHVIGDVSKQLGLVLSPRFHQTILSAVELVP